MSGIRYASTGASIRGTGPGFNRAQQQTLRRESSCRRTVASCDKGIKLTTARLRVVHELLVVFLTNIRVVGTLPTGTSSLSVPNWLDVGLSITWPTMVVPG